MTSKTLLIGTRTSPLALWQTNHIIDALALNNIPAKSILIQSSGDLNLNSPIYALGINGVFTKELDTALLQKKIDLAVHSLKDVPTSLPKGLILAAVPPRAPHNDIIILKKPITSNDFCVATSSLRRRAQWLAKYPNHTILPVRGNVQTRLQKFFDNPNIHGIIFAQAGIQRLDLLSQLSSQNLDWMVPPPAQGALGIICREDDSSTRQHCLTINHQPSLILTSIERQFMNTLEGGCSVPIGALAQFVNNQILFNACIHDFDGKQHFSFSQTFSLAHHANAGKNAALLFLQNPDVKNLLQKIKNNKPL